MLAGDTWLQHHREDLLPYWDLPEAYGDPVGNFPSFRGRAGDVLTGLNTNRGLSTLGRGVYGYSMSFMLTGDEHYLTLARAGLDWIEDNAEDKVNGGYYGELLSHGRVRRHPGPARTCSTSPRWAWATRPTSTRPAIPRPRRSCSRSAT